MRSELRLLPLLLLAACGPGVDDLSIAPAVLTTIHGRVALDALPAEVAGRPLRAALVWGAPAEVDRLCAKFGENPALKQLCPDPLGFAPLNDIQADVAVLPDGTFTLPVVQLPPASVGVGDDTARISWGSVLVAVDSNLNGAFDLLAAAADYGDAPGRGDRIVAASFSSLRVAQQRIAFHEGGWNERLGRFYPAPECAPPLAGFSLVRAPPLGSGLSCASEGTDSVLSPAPVSDADARALACRPVGLSGPVRPNDDPPPTEQNGRPLRQVCLDPETLAVIDDTASCPTVQAYVLAGCARRLFCEKPEWDLRQSPPGWWPCSP